MSNELRIIIAGSRNFTNKLGLFQVCDKIIKNNFSGRTITILSGTARGADRLGEIYAEERGYSLDRYPAEWDKYGKSAGYKRNEKMAKNAKVLIAFWDGKSKGTKHMIDLANLWGLRVFTIKVLV